MKTFRTTIIWATLTAFALINVSCEKEKPAPPRSMEQIKSEEGIPVEVSTIMPSDFSKELSFFSTVSGIVETVEYTKVKDQILSIRAKVGDYVKQGQLLMEFPTNNPSLQYEQAKVALDNSEKSYKRMKELLAAGEISQQVYDNTQAQYMVAKQNMESIEKLVKIKAQVSGTLISIPVRVGDVMGDNQALFTIAQLNKMIAKVQATDSELVQIKKGMPVQALWNGIEYRGVVSDIGMEMNSMTRSFPIEITIDNPKQTLKSGVTVDVRIKVKETDQAIIIDRKLLVDEAGKKYVYLEKDGMATKRHVQTGIASGTNIEITDGLKPGDNLITCCTSFLEDGIKIKLNK